MFENGRKFDLEKVKVIVELNPPSTIKEVQRTFKHIRWYREVIYNYAITSMSIT